MEQETLIHIRFAAGILADLMGHLIGPQESPWLLIPMLLVCLPLLGGIIFLLACLAKTLKDSWNLFRFLRSTRDTYLACTNCGYDLRHKPDRCPECGQPVWFRSRRKTAPPIPPASATTELELPSESPAAPDSTNNDSAQPADR